MRSPRGPTWFVISPHTTLSLLGLTIRLPLSPSSTSLTRAPSHPQLGAMHWLTSDASPNDALFFHYSGHGSQVSTQEKDEADGLAETICPVDYEQEGQVTDDELHEALVKPLPKGCRLTIILDCVSPTRHRGVGGRADPQL